LCRLDRELILDDELTGAVRAALGTLGMERLVLAIHDQSFPSTESENLGRGSPYGLGARRLLRLVCALGFDGVQLGPQGDTSLANPSPYDGALFTKSPLSIALATLEEDPAWTPLCAGLLAPLVAARPPGTADRVQYAYAWHSSRATLAALHARFGSAPSSLVERFEAFRARRRLTLEPDGDFEALMIEHGTDHWTTWSNELDRWLYAAPPEWAALARDRRALIRQRHAGEIDRHLLGQFVLDEQHAALRREAGAAGIALYADLQIGYSQRDVWSRRSVFRADYLMGAPPSRTNPLGQPWGYPVLDPEQYFEKSGLPGPAVALLAARVDRMLADFDGIRIDHPHGLVCPWVYRADDPDPAAAVGRGARLFCSPNVAEHPRLAALAISDAEQLSGDPGLPRYADDWVRALREEQVARYAVLFDAVMTRVTAAGRRPTDVVCEVLSTWPYPLRRVMERYGLGRFCVTQKADLTRTDDVYRSENASPRDWMMLGNHDTPPVGVLADAWHGSAVGAQRAVYLAGRLMPDESLRPRLARWIAADARHLCQAMFADLFAGRARKVSVFFADLFGLRQTYNRPGIVDSMNWTLRLPPTFEDLYRQRVDRAEALDLPLALAMAVRARAPELGAAASASSTRLLALPRHQTSSILGDELRALLRC
jgi:4-alpha-glucanotransferase